MKINILSERSLNQINFSSLRFMVICTWNTLSCKIITLDDAYFVILCKYIHTPTHDETKCYFHTMINCKKKINNAVSPSFHNPFFSF